MAPTLATSCAALPPEGVNFSWGGPAKNLAPTLATPCAALPAEGADGADQGRFSVSKQPPGALLDLDFLETGT